MRISPDSRVVIVGSGFAGASTAMFLAQYGMKRVTVLEAEALPGMHASGRNAGIARQHYSDPALTVASIDGRDYIANWAAATEPERFRPTGSFLIAANADKLQLRKSTTAKQDSRAALFPSSQIRKRVPLLCGANFDWGLHCASDGVVDIAALLQHFIASAQEASAQIRYCARVTAVERAGRRIRGVRLGEEELECDILINAAGAWAPAIAALAAAPPLQIAAFRRHLFWAENSFALDRSAPVVWNVSKEFYFRPESGGLLLSGCEEIPEEQAHSADHALLLLSEKLQRYCPSILQHRIAKNWRCARTLAADHRFVIGWDPAVAGFFWVAALGGHGMTCSSLVGRMAARAIVFGESIPLEFNTARENIRGQSAPG